MCWHGDVRNREQATELRRKVAGYLRAHGEPTSDFHSAEVILGELLSNVARYSPGRVEVHLDWNDEMPLVKVRDEGTGFDLRATLPGDPDSERGRGLYLVDKLGSDLGVSPVENGCEVRSRLPVRKAEATFSRR